MLGLAMSVSLLGLGLDVGGLTTEPAQAAPIECVVTASTLCSNRPPVANPEIKGYDGRTVGVCDRGGDPEGALRVRRWTFGDGATAATECASHTYRRDGRYTVTLYVEDDIAQSDVGSTQVSIRTAAVPVAAASRPSAASSRGARPEPTVVYRDRVIRVAAPKAPPVLREDAHLTEQGRAPRVVEAPRPSMARVGFVASLGVVVVGALLLLVARRRRRAQAHAFDRLTEDFLSNVSHELRTPLTPVKGYAEILGDRRVTKEKARTYAGAILSASEQLERVIDTLVDVAALDAGRVQADRDVIDLAGLVDEVLTSWRQREPERAFRCDVASVEVVGNRRLLAMALEQLVDNAVKFSPRGSEISVTSGRAGRAATIAVSDHGTGIAPGDQEMIFGDFRQADASATRAHGGMGLGLSLVRRVARLHGGDVTVRSAPGAGSTFTLSLAAHAARRRRAAA